MRWGGQDTSAAHVFPDVGTEEGFYVQGFHCGHWSQVLFSSCLPFNRLSKPHTAVVASCHSGSISVMSFRFQGLYSVEETLYSGLQKSTLLGRDGITLPTLIKQR